MALTDSTQLVTEDLDKREGEAMHGQERGCMGANHLIRELPAVEGGCGQKLGQRPWAALARAPASALSPCLKSHAVPF